MHFMYSLCTVYQARSVQFIKRVGVLGAYSPKKILENLDCLRLHFAHFHSGESEEEKKRVQVVKRRSKSPLLYLLKTHRVQNNCWQVTCPMAGQMIFSSVQHIEVLANKTYNKFSYYVEELYHMSLHEHVTARLKNTCILTHKKISMMHGQQIKHGLYEFKYTCKSLHIYETTNICFYVLFKTLAGQHDMTATSEV